MKLNEVDIEVKHSGLLEVPDGKEVDQLPQSHFQKLIDKKGYEAIIRGLTNLEVWNKNKNPKLSKWASDMADKLKVANKKNESYSNKLFEVNARLLKKIGDKTISGLKKSKDYAKTSLAKSADTARNAIVAGAVAPIGAGISKKYSQPQKKDNKYSASDVAAIATALKSKTESYSNKLLSCLSILENATEEPKKESGIKKVLKGAAKGAAAVGALGAVAGGKLGHKIGYNMTGGFKGKIAGGLAGAAAKGVRALTTTAGAGAGAIAGSRTGAVAGGTAAGVKHLHDKSKESEKNESLIGSLEKHISLCEEEAFGESPKPRKKRELTPEQKARRQERRRLRRQLQKQGLEVKKAPRSGPVKTIKGDPVFSNDTLDKVKKARETASAQKTVQAATNTVNKTASNTVNKTASNTAKEATKSLSNNAKKAANKTFKKSQAFRKLVNKAALKGMGKGAAITAGVGALGYAAKKAYDKAKNNRNK